MPQPRLNRHIPRMGSDTTRAYTIQECINAITAEGARVREGANDSWRGGMFYAAETLRKMKFQK
jgi:hypothetical protein